jgi:DNA-binding NtrC family response regulator
VAATNRDLRQEVRAGRFRADLYHRMSVFAIEVPPLRDLGDDQILLLDHFRQFYARQAAAEPFELNSHALTEWLEYSFPGNVRELRNIAIRLTTKYAGQRVDAAQLRAELDTESLESPIPGIGAPADPASRRQLQTERGFNLDETLARWERSYVEAALGMTQGNLTRAAKMLGLNRTTLYSRMQNYGAGGTAPPEK